MTTYVPGGCAAYVAPTMLVVAAGDALDRVVDLARSGGTPSVLEVIGVLSGGDLAALPDFACVLHDGAGLRAVARGGFEVRTQRWTLEGAAAAPWSEQVVPTDPDVTDSVLTIRRVPAEPGPGAPRRLPVQHGVVLTAEVDWRAAAPAPAEPVPAEPVPAEPAPAEPAPADDGFPSDHDGLTVTAARLGSVLPPPPAPAVPPAPRPAPPAAPPSAYPSAYPSAQVPSVPGPVAVLQVSGKPDLVVHRTVLIGRAPQPHRSGSAALPALVVVDDPYVSGTHLEVIRRDAMVLVIDRSSNGTLVKLPGRVAERLVKGVATPVVDGTVLTLSDRVTATVRIEAPGPGGARW
ncbi:FHA domain-containing protein [Nocardioides sp. zg-ZUI104]|uniref:FHA domain-containing protein n=1 Tax=Nocardioides faecalis TaxID=2803858 RepID=UPI001BCFEE31|nr:FHA domain-containing protein [Nocardioides faecalis]MBS4754150.1 FHA domain-containing protein [Nocardioides faecalis]